MKVFNHCLILISSVLFFLAVPYLSPLEIGIRAYAAQSGAVWQWQSPLESPPTQLSGVTNVIAVSAGNNHTLALTADGSVYAWGSNASGQLGNDTVGTQSATPVQVKGIGGVDYLTGIKAISAGGSYSMALRASDGAVLVWGTSLGTGPGSNNSFHQFPTQVITSSNNPLTGVTEIAAGTAHSLAVNSDGRVYAWGSNSMGVLGLGTICDPDAGCGQEYYATLILTLQDIQEVAAGQSHSVAVDINGNVYAWGKTADGALGPDNYDQYPTAKRISPISISQLHDIIDVSAKGTFNVALDKTGKAYSWGANSAAILPIFQVPQLTTISTGIYTRGYSPYTHTGFGIGADGSVWQWDSDHIASQNGTSGLGAVQISTLHNAIAISGGVYDTAPNIAVIGTPLILIPGIMGSEFSVTQSEPISPILKEALSGGGCTETTGYYSYNQGDLIWLDGSLQNLGNKITRPCSNYLDALQLDSQGQNTVYPQVGLNGKLTDIPYNNDTIPSLEGLYGYKRDVNLFIFPYDWRKDIASSSALLDQEINAVLATASAGTKVNILAHSMGGLVAREYIRDAAHAGKVDTLVELGTPNVGTPKMLAALLYNMCLIKTLLGCVPNGYEANKIVQNFPGAFELLPSERYYQLYSNPKDYPFSEDRDMVTNGNSGPGPLTYEQLKTLLSQPQPQSLLNKNMTVFGTAGTFHSNLDPSYSDINTNGVKTYLIAGSGYPTIGQIHDYQGFILLNQRIHFPIGIKQDADPTDGDGTVATLSATLGQQENAYYVNQDHGGLVSGTSTSLEMATNFLSGQTALISGVQTTPFHFSKRIISVHSPVELDAYDDAGNHTGVTSDGSTEENIPGSSYDEVGEAKFISLPSDGHYRITTKATDEGSFDLKLKTYQNSALTKELVYLAVPQTTQTTTSLSLDSENPSLSVDVNGDGSTIQHLAATSTLTGDALSDHTPPTTSAQAAGTQGNNGWYLSNVTLTLTAQDSGSGVLQTLYSVDNGESYQPYTNPLIINTNGVNKVFYFSRDNAGNAESPKEFDVNINNPVSISVSPASANVSIGTPFTVDITATSGDQAFNAAQASVNVSSNFAITSLTHPSSNACGFTYTQAPTTSDPSFAGAIFGSSKTSCTVYRLTLVPTASGTGTVRIVNASLKAYSDGAELHPSVQHGSYTIVAALTPIPTPPLAQLTVTSPSETYNTSFVLAGTKDAAATSVSINGSTDGVTFPTSTTWQKPVSLSVGVNSFLLYSKDDNGHQTATITATVNRHPLGDINGDGVVDLVDFSLFAADWGKTSNLTNPLSDMNGDSAVDLTDYSILAKLEAE